MTVPSCEKLLICFRWGRLPVRVAGAGAAGAAGGRDEKNPVFLFGKKKKTRRPPPGCPPPIRRRASRGGAAPVARVAANSLCRRASLARFKPLPERVGFGAESRGIPRGAA